MRSYYTVAQAAAAEFVEKRSRFIAEIAPVRTEAEAAERLAAKRAERWDATHNCYAYILREGGVQRYSDDGEPQGTAGMPILEVLRRRKLVDALIVVTRYFGGTLLGAGGLTRVYAHGATLAVAAAQVLYMRRCAVFSLEAPYTIYGKLQNLIAAGGAEVLETAFAAEVLLTLRLPLDKLGAFRAQLCEASAGSLDIRPIREEFAPARGEETENF